MRGRLLPFDSAAPAVSLVSELPAGASARTVTTLGDKIHRLAAVRPTAVKAIEHLVDCYLTAHAKPPAA